MAKFDDYTQKNTPEDNDITLILDKTANVNKKTPFSGIWNWIVNKMTNAVIQNLQTTNKTVIGSINELNSKFETVHYNLSGDSNMDIELDNTKPGIYVLLIFHMFAGINMYTLQTYYSQTSTKSTRIINNYSEYNVTSKGSHTINVSQSGTGGSSDIYLYRLV